MNPEKYNENIVIEISALQLMAIHGNICLALRHSQNKGPSRALAEDFIVTAEQSLLQCGLLNEDDIKLIHKTERECTGEKQNSQENP